MRIILKEAIAMKSSNLVIDNNELYWDVRTAVDNMFMCGQVFDLNLLELYVKRCSEAAEKKYLAEIDSIMAMIQARDKIIKIAIHDAFENCLTSD